MLKKISPNEFRTLKCPVKCRKVDDKIESLADYMAIISGLISGGEIYWFRGHANINWTLKPSALRYNVEKRKIALGLLNDFKRIAEIKLPRPPRKNDLLDWLQLAQHYGMPTRLLDWTESAIFGLYFACYPKAEKTDGIVFLFNHKHLSQFHNEKSNVSEDVNHLIEKYISLGPLLVKKNNGLSTLAIKPAWNSERIMMQRGVFTLHGSEKFALDNSQAESLVGIPILRKHKDRLRNELDRIGIDELTMFPELEYVSQSLKRKAGLL